MHVCGFQVLLLTSVCLFCAQFVVKRAALDQDGSLRMITQCTTTLSTDARVVDEEVAALFLKELTICLAAPEFMLW